MLGGTLHRQAVSLRALLDGLLADFGLSARPLGVTFEALAFVDELNANVAWVVVAEAHGRFWIGETAAGAVVGLALPNAASPSLTGLRA